MLSRVRLFATPWSAARQAPPYMEFSRPAISFSRRSSWPRDWTQASSIAGRFLPSEPPNTLVKEVKCRFHCLSFTCNWFLWRLLIEKYVSANSTYVLCLVTQSCLTLWDLMDCSLPGSSVHGDSPGKNTGVGCHALLQGIFPTQGWNPGLLQCKWILYHLSHHRSPFLSIKSESHYFVTIWFLIVPYLALPGKFSILGFFMDIFMLLLFSPFIFVSTK